MWRWPQRGMSPPSSWGQSPSLWVERWWETWASEALWSLKFVIYSDSRSKSVQRPPLPQGYPSWEGAGDPAGAEWGPDLQVRGPHGGWGGARDLPRYLQSWQRQRWLIKINSGDKILPTIQSPEKDSLLLFRWPLARGEAETQLFWLIKINKTFMANTLFISLGSLYHNSFLMKVSFSSSRIQYLTLSEYREGHPEADQQWGWQARAQEEENAKKFNKHFLGNSVVISLEVSS